MRPKKGSSGSTTLPSSCSPPPPLNSPPTNPSLLVQMYFQHKPVREKSDELKAILEKIQLEKDREAYSEMIRVKSRGVSLSLGDTIGLTSAEVSTENEDWKQVRKSLTLIANILFSVLGTIGALFWLLHHSYQFPFEHAVLSSFFFGLVVFFVELALYWNFF